jgi:branched-chain amino acid transport system ATP-binding protein
MKPRVLMLDEVNAGLNSSEIDQAIDMIRKIAARGITIIVIEHLMRILRELAPRAVVLHHGAVLCSGPTDEVFNNPQVIEAYLGTKFAQRVTTEAR